VAELARGKGVVMDGFHRRVLSEWPDWASRTEYDVTWYTREKCWLVARGEPGERTGVSIVDVDDREDVLLSRWMAVGQTEHGGRLTRWHQLRMSREARYWRSVHVRCAQDADVVVFASEHDAQTLGFANATVVRNSYDVVRPAQSAAPGPTILFQGFMRWFPNEDAAGWLCREIFPRIRERVPDSRIVLAGDASNRVRALGEIPGVEVVGPVPDMGAQLRRAALVAVPIRVGGGTRIKIVEAFAHGVPVVSTSIGAEGLSAIPGVHLDLADTTDAFADSCCQMLVDRERARRLATAAAAFHADRYTTAVASRQVREAVGMALAAGRSRSDSGQR
jgi:hypothetical protein